MPFNLGFRFKQLNSWVIGLVMPLINISRFPPKLNGPQHQFFQRPFNPTHLFPERRWIRIDPPRITVLGDSMLRGMDKLLHATITMLPGATLSSIKRHLEDMPPDDIRRLQILVIWVGTNDHASPLELVKQKYVAILNTLKVRYSHVHICFLGLLPRPRDLEATRSWTTKVNGWLKSATRRVGHKFIPLVHLVQTRTGLIHHFLFRDGLHLSAAGTHRVRDHLRQRLTALFPLGQ